MSCRSIIASGPAAFRGGPDAAGKTLKRFLDSQPGIATVRIATTPRPM